MNKSTFNNEHYSHRTGWLRAAVLGANDGIVSTASLVIGVASAGADAQAILLVGTAGLVAGAMSMAAGEYVSVSSQADSEKADLEIEKGHLARSVEYERKELAAIYQGRGLKPDLAMRVAIQLMEHDALDAHARDELGIIERTSARPFQAAFASALAFVIGAILPLLSALLAGYVSPLIAVPAISLLSLVFLGALSTRLGGAPMMPGIIRVVFWGAAAMALTAITGALFEQLFLS
ncbi:VIT1/CCC1 transporter family protein [Teredinibacter franksiae]|uniref:VIT1/CCC1 transporter family protein n=1 Tax=Teredinibacter franksiae TaxID=2761453 RepID=UPI00162540D0|nr:VIT family protein [Teredinibacter franksiae]